MSRNECVVYEPYNRLYETSKKIIVMDSGRIAGKNYATADAIINCMLTKQKFGAVLLRANYSQISSGPFRLMLKRLAERNLLHLFEYKQEPYRFICKVNGNIAYFWSVNAQSKDDLTQTKGLEVEMPIGIVWLDEADQSYSGDHIEEAMATFNRHLRDDGFYVFSYNPPALKLHWAHEYFAQLKKSKFTERIYATWHNIADTLNEITKELILRTKSENYTYYRWKYLGEMVSFQGLILSQYIEERHKIPLEKFKEVLSNTSINFVIWGIDGGVSNDSTAMTCNIVTRSGRLFVANQYKYNPKKHGKISPARQAIILKKFVQHSIELYNLDFSPMVFIFDADSASQNLMLSFQDISHYDCRIFGKKDFWADTGRMQDAIDADKVILVDRPQWIDYAVNQAYQGSNPLEDEILSYAYDPRTNDVPSQAEDHLIAATRYVIGAIFKDKAHTRLDLDEKYIPKGVSSNA